MSNILVKISLGIFIFMASKADASINLLTCKKVDLTHTIDTNIPLWPGSAPFKKNLKVDYPQGCRVFSYEFVAGTGTHFDAPSHFIKDMRDIAELTIDELIAPVSVINIVEVADNNPDYTLSAQDIYKWESKNGQIKAGSVILVCTGWSKYWSDPKKYCNMDQSGAMHFPGVSVEAAQLLLQRNIKGLGIDTFSPDAGLATHFPVHHLLLPHNIYFIENLTNLDLLPVQGAYIIALPLKIKDGVEAPGRVIALLP